MVELPVRRRAILDDRCLPTERTEAASYPAAALGGTVLDDLFVDGEPGDAFALSGGGRRIEVVFDDGYPVSVVYAPVDDDVVCFEPMTAPTNPFEGPVASRLVDPGASYAATVRISASAA